MNTTGDPTLDSVLAWLTGGGTLTSPGAAIALAFMVHSVLVPVLERLATKFKWNLSGPTKVQGVYGLSVVLVALTGLATHSIKTLAEAVILGIMVANIAMGIHSTRSVAADASDALRASQP